MVMPGVMFHGLTFSPSLSLAPRPQVLPTNPEESWQVYSSAQDSEGSMFLLDGTCDVPSCCIYGCSREI